MLKLLLLTFLLSIQPLYAQDLSQDLGFLETQNTDDLPYNIPLYVDLLGNVQILSNTALESTTIYPMGNISYKRSTSLYIRPIQRSQFSFDQLKEELGWIEVKRKRWEVSVGVGANIGPVISLGLTPYKGARQVMVRHKKTQNEVTQGPILPDDLEEMEAWSVGDHGSFQRYGGIHLQAGVKLLGVNALTAGLTIQSLWSLSLKKLLKHKIQLSLAEENLNKRRLQTGVPVLNTKLHWFSGKRLTLSFELDLKNPEHAELYRQALKGRFDELQTVLDKKAQRLQWKGSERLGYFGVPTIAGRTSQRSKYEMIFDDELDVLDVKSRINSGILLPMRNHHKLVYQTNSALSLFWFSEMNKADEKLIAEKFLNPGKILGAKGFENTLPPGTMVGSTLSQMGMSFTKEELDAVTPEMLTTIMQNFKLRCETLKLSCDSVKRQRKIHKKLLKWMGQKWEKVRDSLGFLMIEEPALIHSYIKAINSKKKLYFKFLNEKYQSMEGAATIEI